MKTLPWTVVAGIALVTLGCRTDPAIELLERQNRLLEDEIYRLRECVADYQAMLQRRGSQGLLPRDEVEAGGPAFPTPSSAGDFLRSTLPEDERKSSAATQATPPPSAEPGLQEPRQAVPPKVEPGRPLQQGQLPGVLEKFRTPPGSESPPPPSAEESPQTTDPQEPLPGPPAEPTTSAVDSSQATQLVLNRLLTGGYDADGRPGDEGIVVVVEPRDAQGRPVEAPAPMAVVLLDPALQGEAARVARWDLTAQQTGTMLLTAGLGRGIGLELAWPNGPPAHDQLHLFVRYVTSDGRRLEAGGRIRIRLGEDRTAGWVAQPRSAARQPAAAQKPPTRWATEDQSNSAAARPTTNPPALQGPKHSALQRPAWSPYRLQ